jgi:23S rRNA pseudouridine1911/1915/1917 synthase
VTAAEHLRRLDDLVGARLHAAVGRRLSRSVVRRLVMAGAVRVEGRPVRRPGMPVAEGHVVEALVDPRRLPARDASARARAAADQVRVVYRDEVLLAVDKPPGVPVHATADAARRDLFSAVRDFLAHERHARGGAMPYLGLHHRLDRDTSGVVLFTTDPSANGPLARAFADRTVSKAYHALTVPGEVSRDAWTVTIPLGMVGTGRHARMGAVKHGDAAETTFRLLRRLGGAHLVEARPVTGRKHQVRAHLSAGGSPILGDGRYGGPSRVSGIEIPRVMLHALRLDLPHPITGRPFSIRCPYPDDFEAVIAALRTPEAERR